MSNRLVAVIISIVFVIGAVGFVMFFLPKIRRVQHQQNVSHRMRAQAISLAMTQYLQDNNDKFPIASQWKKALTPYIAPPIVPDLDGYDYSSGVAGKSIAKLDSPGTTAVFISKPNSEHARTVVYADGWVHDVPVDERLNQ